MINRIKAFTLAEVLITLGIIGVVAALTIPTLMAKTKQQQTTVALKKFYSTMQQAIKLSEVDNGDCANWSYDNSEPNAGRTFFNTYLLKYMQYLKTEDVDVENYKVYLSDGGTVQFKVGDCVDMIYDVNGLKNPNFFGRDMFDFIYCKSPINELYFTNKNKHFGAFAEGMSREKALEQCKSKSFGYQCSALLILDNWEFKDDYPYKL